jgi:hypothetical protein
LGQTAATINAQQVQTAPPDWANQALARTAPNALIDADTHQPLILSDDERKIIIKAMDIMNDAEPDRRQLALLQAGIAHYKSGAQLTMADATFINGPLMMVQSAAYAASPAHPDGITPEEIATIKGLLRRLRKSASAMATTK